jgi:hypothetical protein
MDGANKRGMNTLDWMFEQLWNTPKDKWEWNAILNKSRNMQNEHNKQMSENKLNFLKSQIRAFNPEWTKEQIEMEAIRIYNEANTIDDDDEGCLYCGS